MNKENKVVLIGPMGAGKTTIGTILATELSWKYFDNDSEMTSRYGFSQTKLAAMSVPDLHALESRYLADVLKESAPFISGAAGSVVDYENCRQLLKAAKSIYLRIPLELVLARAGKMGVGRQALEVNAEKILTERYERRDPLYKEVAELTIDLTNQPVRDAREIAKFLIG